MESVLVWLAVMAATFHMAQTMQCRVRVTGTFNCDIASGRIEVCAETIASNCTRENVGHKCDQIIMETACSQCAGIVCITDRECPTLEAETTPPHTCTCPMGEATPAEHTGTPPLTGGVVGGAQQSCPSLAALGGGLGALTAILAILLVGVVIGWVWSCYRKTEISELPERPLTSPHPTFPNPSYTVTSPATHAPSVQYSSLGPRGTPLNHSPSAAQPTPPAIYDVINENVDMGVPFSQPPQGGEEGVYQVLEDHQEAAQEKEGGGGGEAVYHVLEDPREMEGSGGGGEAIYNVLENPQETAQPKEDSEGGEEAVYHVLEDLQLKTGGAYEVPTKSA